jgi:transposase
VLAACWAHTRRKFFDVHEATGSPIAAEALRRIAELYAIEKSIRGRTAEERRSVRNTKSRLLVEAMRPWLQTQLGRIPGGGGLADAIRYSLSRWPALCHFLDDGRIELDNNSVERAIRPVALGRKNHLSPVPMPALSDGRPSLPSSPLQSSTTWSLSPISGTSSSA